MYSGYYIDSFVDANRLKFLVQIKILIDIDKIYIYRCLNFKHNSKFKNQTC